MFGGWLSDFFVKYDMTSVAELANSLTGSGGEKVFEIQSSYQRWCDRTLGLPQLPSRMVSAGAILS